MAEQKSTDAVTVSSVELVEIDFYYPDGKDPPITPMIKCLAKLSNELVFGGAYRERQSWSTNMEKQLSLQASEISGYPIRVDISLGCGATSGVYAMITDLPTIERLIAEKKIKLGEYEDLTFCQVACLLERFKWLAEMLPAKVVAACT